MTCDNTTGLSVDSARPLGTLGYAQVVAPQVGILAKTDVIGLSVTVTVGAGRRIQISGSLAMLSNVNDDVLRVYIMEGATDLQIRDITYRNLSNENYEMEPQVVLTPSAGAHTYKIAVQRFFGTGNVVMRAGPTFPAFILVEDIGV